MSHPSFRQYLTRPRLLLSALAAVSLLVGVAVRLYRLSWPGKEVFDEVYFPHFAWQFLQGQEAFDVHPPLGKFLIALGLAAFGNQPFGWRIVPALFGIGLVILTAALWQSYQRDRTGALFLLAALSTEPFLVTYSRTGLLDGILLVFILACFWSASLVRSARQLLLPLTLFGLAVAVKWIGLGVIVPMAYLLWRRRLLPEFVLGLPWSLLIYGLVVYAGQLVGHDPHPFADMLTWHRQALDYHLYLTATHPWSSLWWSWPFMLRPVLFFYELNEQGAITMISAIGNPILWWSSTVAVAVSLVTVGRELLARRWAVADHPLVPLLMGWLAFYLPWVPIHRVLFLYHYLPCYGFALLMLAYWVGRLDRRLPWLALGFTFLIVAFGIFYLPMATAWPMSQAWLDHRLWFQSWL